LKTFDWKSILIDNQLKTIDCLKNQSKTIDCFKHQSENCGFLSGGLKILKYGFWGLMA